jgi:5-methylcytosine-specific restriction endonuclease McrA
MERINEFSTTTKEQAFARQKNRCGSCGASINKLGFDSILRNKYGERAEAHHIEHIKYGGLSSVENCVIICQSCHYSLHEGGNYRYGTVIGKKKDYSYFKG